VQSDELSYVGRTFKNKFQIGQIKKVITQNVSSTQGQSRGIAIAKVEQHEVPPPQKKDNTRPW
jgi:hypothetical protein